MSLAADKKRWDDLHAALAKSTEAVDTYDRQLHAHYGRYETQWLTKTQRAKLEALQAKKDKIGDKIYELLERVSPRDWSSGVPSWWIRSTLTWEDAIRPKNEPLSVVPPTAWGSNAPMQERTVMARRTPRKNTPESAGSQYATDQIASEHFAAWVRDQMLEASKADPSEQLPLETKADARVIAQNMLKQLEWDTKRELGPLDIMVLIDPNGENVGGNEKTRAFWDGFRKACDNSRDWLADELLTIKGEMGEARQGHASEKHRSPPITRVVISKVRNGWIMKVYDSAGHLRSGVSAPSSLEYVKGKAEEWFPGVPVEQEEGASSRPKAVGSVRRRR